MKHRTTAQGRGRLSTRVGRWLRPRRLAIVGASGMLLGGGLFGVVSHVIPATAANFTVDTTLDLALTPSNSTTCNTAGTCSLRAAVEASNNAGGTNVITVPAGTYNLSLGELQVAPAGGMSVTVNGASAASTIIHASQPVTCTSNATSTCFRVFDVDPGTHGAVNFTLTGATVSGGRTAQFGGAGLITGPISSSSTADNTTITNDTFSDNVLYGGSTTTPGGAISQVYGHLTVSGSTFTNNSAGASVGGAIDLEDLGGGSQQLSVSNSTFTGNTAGVGGAVKFAGTPTSPTSSITGSTFTGNTSTTSGGALATGGASFTIGVSSSTFTGNGSVSGGAIHNAGGTLSLDYSRLYNNTASTADAAVLNASTINANTDWWGVNAGPGSGANFTPTDWQVLTSTASPSTIRINQTSTVTGDLDHTHLGSTIAPAHHIPDGPTMTFANGTFGTVSPTSGTLSSGAVSTTYTAGSTGGAEHVPTTFDGQTVNASITVQEPPHITSANNKTFLAGSLGSFQVTATGYPAPTFTKSGTLPSGVTLSSAGLLSGTPATGTGGVYTISITATNAVTPDDTQNPFTLTVNEAAFITSANSTTFTTGSPGTYTITSRGYPLPSITLTSGSLPSGVTYDAPTHVLSGTPASGTGGQYALQFTSHNGIGSDSVQSFTLTVNQPPAITSGNSTTFTVGSPGTFSVIATGFPAPTITETGTLPSGVTLATNGTLSGTPAAATGGTYPITIKAANGVTPDATQNFTLTVDEAPSVTSANSTTFTTGSAGTFSVTTTGFPKAAITKTGALPSGVTLTDNTDGTATLAGTPAAGTGGTYPITIKAANGVAPDATQSFTLTVHQAPAITSANSTTFTVGSVGSFSVTTTGFPTGASMVITKTGALPSGVTFVDNGDGTATLGGTPGPTSAGSYPLTVGANNGVAPAASQDFTLTVEGAPHITSADHTTFVVGQAGTFTVTTTGSTPMTISETGSLPSGVTFVDNSNGTATLAGTPGAGSAGTYPLTIKASNGQTPDDTQSFTLQVNQVAAITSADNTTFTVGTLGTFTVQTTGTPIPVISKTGTLPGGVTFIDNGDRTATLTGTPAAGTGGTYTLTIKASNGVGTDATQTFTLTVDQAPAITSASTTTFTVGSLGSFDVTTTGFPKPTITKTSGTLPTGLNLVDNGDGTATISGTPAAGTGGTYDIGLKAANGVGSDATQTLTITVDESAYFTSADHTTFTVGTGGSFDVTTGGFPVSSVGESGALPSGVTYADNGNGTGTLSGTPMAGTGGVYHLTFTAHNGIGSDATQPFTLTVNEAPAITSADHVTFTVGTPGSFNVNTHGYPLPTVTESGALPGGVTYADNGNGTGTLSGTPATDSGGVYAISFTAGNTSGSDAVQSFTLTVDEASGITSADHTTFTVGSAGSFGVTTRGYPKPALSKSGALPSGVTFVDNGNGTATLAGTPAAGTGGTYALTITASNGVGSDATQPFTLTVNEAPAITSADHVTFTTGSAGNFTVTSHGYPLNTLSESGALPGGVTFTDNGNNTATLQGTPNSGTGGVYTLALKASNTSGPDATQTFTLTVDQPAAITSANSTTFTAGSANSFGVTTSGFPAPSLTETGTLPSGVTFADNGNGTGTLSGNPATGTGGVYHVSLKAHNGVGSDATQSFTLTVNEAAAITSADHTSFQVGAPGTFTVTTRGYPVPSVGKSGTLPTGVSYTDNGDGTGTLSGTPATGTGGTYHLTFTAHNGVGSDGTQAFTLQVGPAPTTTTVTATTTTPNFGSPDTFTATVAPQPPSTGTPAGSVTFAVDGTTTAVVTLVSGQAQWTTSSLQQGAHTISASYGGQTNTFQASNGSIGVNTGCAVTYNTRIPGSLTISSGSACINGARISGGVSISGGASVSIVNSTIGNGVTSNGARLLTICMSSVGGSLSVTNSTGFVLIGSNGDDSAMPCPGNTIGGGVTLTGNTGGVELGGNPSIKGAVTVNNNVLAGSAVDAENGAPEIEHNSIKGSLSCNGNTPAPTNDGAPNTVSGARVGQCSASGF